MDKKYGNLEFILVFVLCLIGTATQQNVVDLSIETKSQNKIAKPGDIVIFECVFNQPVSCVWYRNGNIITMRERYNFANPEAKSGAATNCTIKIDNVQLFDFGSWKCTTFADSAVASTPSLDNLLSNDASDNSGNYFGTHLFAVFIAVLLMLQFMTSHVRAQP